MTLFVVGTAWMKTLLTLYGGKGTFFFFFFLSGGPHISTVVTGALWWVLLRPHFGAETEREGENHHTIPYQGNATHLRCDLLHPDTWLCCRLLCAKIRGLMMFFVSERQLPCILVVLVE